MEISTKKGDQGYTDIKEGRIKKNDEIINTLGLIDETIAYILLADSYQNIEYVKEIVNNLSAMAAIIAGYEGQFDNNLVKILEIAIKDKKGVFTFTYPYKNKEKCYLNLARTKIRTLERQLYNIKINNDNFYIFINRLSDYFFTKIS